MFANSGLIAAAAAFSTLFMGAALPAGPAKKPTPRVAKAAPHKSAKAKKASKGGPTAADVAKGIQRFYDSTDGFTARFTQVVKKRGLRNGIRRSGQVYLKKGRIVPATKTQPKRQDNGKMRWDYPKEEIYYFSDGEVLWTYERRERLAVRLPVKNSRLYQATSYLVGQGDLQRDFDLSLGKSPLKGTIALKMKPKAGNQTMRSLTLVVDARTYAVKASILVDPLGDSTTLHFSKTTHGPIADKIFAWTPPKGVRVKRL